MDLTEAEEAHIAKSERLCADLKKLNFVASTRAAERANKMPMGARRFFGQVNAAAVAPVNKPVAAPTPVAVPPSQPGSVARHTFNAMDDTAKHAFMRAGCRLADLPKPAPAASYLPACDVNFVPEDGAGKTMLRGPFFSMSARDQSAWVRSGGRIVEVATATTVSPRSRTINWAAFTNLTDHEKQCFFRNGGRLVD